MWDILRIVTLAIAVNVLILGTKDIYSTSIKKPVYKTNLPRQTVIDLLLQVANDSVAVFVPGDTSLTPYLIKYNRKPNISDYVHNPIYR